MTYKVPEGWEEVKLGKCCTIKGGKRLPKGSVLITNATRHPYIRIRDMYQHKYIENNGSIEFIDNDTFEAISKYTVSSGDVIIAIVGNTIGLVSLIGKSLDKANLTENCVKLVNLQNCFPEFIYYYLRSNIGQHEIISNIVGTSQPKLPIYGVQNINILLPQMEEQTKIVNILSAIDDKIELNNKINQNLEAQAQAIFKSWFIDFEQFQDGEFVESELGMIPKGWEVGELGNSKLGKLITSGIEDYNGQKIYLATADVSETKVINNDTLITIKDRPSRANMQPRPNTIWFAKMKDSRKLILVDKLDYVLQNNYIFSTGFAGIQCSELSIYYLWTYIQSELFDIKKNSLCTGTTMQAINNGNINKIKILIPEKTILEKFNKAVGPMYQIIINTREQNIHLAELRDTLLPKLMSGEIRIPLDK